VIGIDRRALVKGAAGALAGLALGSRANTARAEPEASVTPAPRRPLDFRPFEDALAETTDEIRCKLDPLILEATAPQLQADLDLGRYSGVELVSYYLDRIRRFDATNLHSVIELNPEALQIAATLDSERAAGQVRGPLHGVPILLKDNIGTGDLLRTTAGAVALSDARCDRDAHLVAGLRDSGALILGKANMSEWAYWMSYVAPSGFSALGGQVVCPYGEAIDPVGSSTGSAVAISANLAAMSVGTETMGSIIGPSSRASVVGMKPTLGLISRDRVLPISEECDSAGPMGRTVTDVALALTAMASRGDVRDRHSHRAEQLHGTDFTVFLNEEGLRGKRIGVIGIEVPELALGTFTVRYTGLAGAVQAMQAAGAKVTAVMPAEFELGGPGLVPEFNWSLREGVDAYLAATDAPARSLAEVIAFNDENPGRFAPWGQDRLRDCLWSSLGEQEARLIGRANRQQAREYLTALLDGSDLDALVGVDTMQSMIYPFAGFPAITVPAGVPWGAPVGVTFIGRAASDRELIAMAYAYEQASRLRMPPGLALNRRPCTPPGTGSRSGGRGWSWGPEAG
jgi:amidase